MLIYDIEIIKAIPSKNEPRIEGIAYCEGWHDHVNMGISVIGCYDYVEDRYRVFCKDNFDDFQLLVNESETIVGFNSLAFDNKVCAANGINVPASKSLDLLVEIWKAAGLSETFQYPTHLGYGLDAVCEANFDRKKTGHGALAPVQWQNGEIGSVIDYCLNDVALTKEIVDEIARSGKLLCPKTTKVLNLENVITR